MLKRTESPLAVMCLMALCGCAGVSTGDRLVSAPESIRGNATVRAAVYVEAASNVPAPSPILASDLASTTRNAAARGKQDKRAVQPSRKNKPTTGSALPAQRVGTPSDTAGRTIEQNVPLSATGYRYTYAVELDVGGTRAFGFANDQGLIVGDRVLVNDTGVVLLRK